jgi:hypothetical protein
MRDSRHCIHCPWAADRRSSRSKTSTGVLRLAPAPTEVKPTNFGPKFPFLLNTHRQGGQFSFGTGHFSRVGRRVSLATTKASDGNPGPVHKLRRSPDPVCKGVRHCCVCVASSWPTFSLTDHAARRMGARGVSVRAVELALVYGRATWIRGARIVAIERYFLFSAVCRHITRR